MISLRQRLTACAVMGLAGLAHAQAGQALDAEARDGTDGAVVAMERIDPPAAAGARWINITAAGDGIIASWVEPVARAGRQGDDAGGGRRRAPVMRMRFARYDRGSWGEASTVIESDRLFVNWADFPSVNEVGGSLVAHFLERSGEATYAYDVQLARSTDDGKTWTRIGPAHHDGIQAEHGFVSFVGDGAGGRAFWLDGRETAGGGHGGGKGRMTLRTALIGDAGTDEGEAVDASVCDCCSTDAAMTSDGPIVVYRDRSFREVRDIAIVRKTERGWTKPRLVSADGWEIAACPVNGPAVAAVGERVVVAWYTGETKNGGGGGRVMATFSSDSGATFGPAIVVDARDDNGFPHGRVDVVLDDRGSDDEKGGGAIVSWLDSAGGGAGAVRLRRVSSDGVMSEVHTAFAASPSRRSGFARIERIVTPGGASDDAAAIIAWTDPADGFTVRAAKFALDAIR
jgi:hypothetical protein